MFSHRVRTPQLIRAVAAVWTLAVAAGLVCLVAYEGRPGSEGRTYSEWPPESRIVRAQGQPQLLFFMHPRCPCTRASLSELTKLMSDCRGLANAHVLVYLPREGSADWRQTDLWRIASESPGVTVMADFGGVEQKRFGIETSGHALLYNAEGKLAFSGGITASRGHAGDNTGRSVLAAMLRGHTDAVSGTLVFGCPFSRRS